VTRPSPEFAGYPSLRDRTVFISGGATGLGAEFVCQFAAQGAKVGFVDVDEEHGRELAGQVGSWAETTPLFVPADVRNIDQLRAGIAAVAEEFGPITVLVNNAANDERHDFATVEPEYWDRSQAVNLRHHFFAIQAVVPGMRAAGGGSIINLGSVAPHSQLIGMPSYMTAKMGIEGLTRTMARELGPDLIRVNCVLPGWVMTPRQLSARLTPEGEALIDSNQCLPGRLMPDDVARLLLWLAARDSAMVTGQMMNVNAGWT
jgi:NAD(P)-dependent dehydrogenase (short-subunit alcohol dehydrogenase family)